MDKTFAGTVDFRDVVRFGCFMVAEAAYLPNDGGDALHELFEKAKPMLVRREAAEAGRATLNGGARPASCSPMTS